MPFLKPKSTLFMILILICPAISGAWNEDYTIPPPAPRGVCIKNLSDILKNNPVSVRTVSSEEGCNADEIRYQWVFGKEPKGSMALIPMKTVRDTLPPSVPAWPANENASKQRIWHFTCVATVEKQILGTAMKTYVFKGEITASSKYQSCESAYTMAQAACADQMGGNDLYEQCSGGSNYPLEQP